ncbi:MAG: hypothetical protein HKM95_15570 [Inquilinus sp.]|nr:hypothetical protein [Inquilinus sp.]
MPLLRTLIWSAARKLASDPRVQRMAADAYEKARPNVEETAREIRDAAREASPLDDPGAFARKVKDRLTRKD